MNNLKFRKDTLVCFEGKNDVMGALTEAKQFILDNDLDGCDLEFNNFTFGIVPDSDLNEDLEDYKHWLQCKK
ncbi:MAG: hypothetical protein P1P88_05010 [Bacteroidales bacterium]|nr:hypothetical protein [Bacteroidales bacterium]